ncbi:MAG TPA: AraC family transcriptional regulator [Sedimentibacter sp.]|nr:AraC family transcriptional regulator [Sedimentibacter sp.]
MYKNFDYFIKKIPVNIHNDTKSIISENIAIFIPDKFVLHEQMIVEEYHFVIFHSTPPPITIDKKQYLFQKGSITCMTPGKKIIVHPFSNPSQSKYMTICINKGFFEKVYKRLGLEGKPVFVKINNKYSQQLLEAIESLIFEILNYEETNQLMIESLEYRIAIQLMRDSELIPTESSNYNDIYIEYVQCAIKYIETHYSSNIKIKDICNTIYVSESYFQRIFLKYTKMTPYQFIMDCRCKKAKEMLITLDIPIEEIARRCGFVNISHFSATFKKREGTTPLSYRKDNMGLQRKS